MHQRKITIDSLFWSPCILVRISEYIRIKKMIRIWYEQIFVSENIRINSNIRIFATSWTRFGLIVSPNHTFITVWNTFCQNCKIIKCRIECEWKLLHFPQLWSKRGFFQFQCIRNPLMKHLLNRKRGVYKNLAILWNF